jgi:hypothetical protein
VAAEIRDKRPLKFTKAKVSDMKANTSEEKPVNLVRAAKVKKGYKRVAQIKSSFIIIESMKRLR